MVEIATELDDGQLMKYRVRPMLQTKTRLRDGTPFIANDGVHYSND
jgi:hypothetical protein